MWAWTSLVWGDHPRTRGVYTVPAVADRKEYGSSPHTRGLLVSLLPRQAGPRIIPAHAGFTPDDRPQGRPGPDHPRTRGVYIAPAVTAPAAIGSSPHTRGLLHVGASNGADDGIIPAHAGFTSQSPGGGTARADHPRTRGVYAGARHSRFRAQGSSPHTRGLRSQWRSSPSPARIIPAHAGFTSSPPAPTSPRCGSSPHTRGLLGSRLVSSESLRIIPAHAGFTPSPRSHPTSSPDHPRTRGVYLVMGDVMGDPAGSSPHTRGLREAPLEGVQGEGIIPAHAGFTHESGRLHPARRDHPRTRGVYFGDAMEDVKNQGSSPHTRGLLRGRHGGRQEPGIIPAHAGFTRSGLSRVGRRRDHPRTRGVYSTLPSSRLPLKGSSPHTRGLLGGYGAWS